MVTWTGLLSVLGIIAGLCTAAFGALEVFAGGMSDAPAEGAAVSRSGCTVLVIGLVLIVAGILGLAL